MKKFYFVTALAAIAIIASCSKNAVQSVPEKTLYLDLPDTMTVYWGDSTTNYRVTLGRVLFYDTRLSLNNTIACASCHKQAYAFADNGSFSLGYENRQTLRNSMPLENIGSSVAVGFFNGENLFWDGRESSLTDLVSKPLANHIEMGIADLNSLPGKLSNVPYYQALFTKAYGSPTITVDGISNAVASFIGLIQSGNTKFDRNDLNALELQGKNLFTTKYNCANCHNLFGGGGYSSGAGFEDIGLDDAYGDPGRGGITGKQADLGKFRTPNLRNVALTAPYMHDGRFKTLDEVLEHYSHNIKNSPNLDTKLIDPATNKAKEMNISSQEKQALMAFLNSLTDYSMISDPRFSNPFKTR